MSESGAMGLLRCSVVLALLVGCTSAQRAPRSRTAQFHVKLAANYYLEGNIPMAQKEIHEALRIDPNNAEAYHVQGFIYLGLKEYVQATFAFKRALELKPDYYEARNNLGAALIAQGRCREAIEVLTPLVNEPLYATPSHALGNIGFCYLKSRDYRKARDSLERAVFLNPRFCKGYNLLGQVYERLGDRESAIRAWKKAVELCNWFAEPHYHLGRMAEAERDPALARKEFEKCAELAGDTMLGRRCRSRL